MSLTFFSFRLPCLSYESDDSPPLIEKLSLFLENIYFNEIRRFKYKVPKKYIGHYSGRKFILKYSTFLRIL